MAESILFLRIIKSVIGCIGLIGNITVGTVIYKVRTMHTLTNAFIFNQAIMDLFGSLLLILSSNIPIPSPLPDTPWFRFVCHIWVSNLFLWASFTSSTVNLLALTCERYVAIVYPFRYHTMYSSRSVTVIMSVIWLSGLIVDGTYTAAVNTFTEDGQCYYNSSLESRAIGIIFILIKFFVPAIFMVFVYSHIMVELKRSANRIGVTVPTVSSSTNPAAPPQPESQEQSLLRARRNTFKTLFIVFITFLVCWTPNQIIFFMFNFGWSLDFSGAIYIISVTLVAANSCINPFIYAFKYKQFRRGFLSLIGRSSVAEFQGSDAPTRAWRQQNGNDNGEQ